MKRTGKIAVYGRKEYDSTCAENKYKKATAFHKNNEKLLLFGGDKRDRTADLLTASQALSQLSYTPNQMLHFGTFGSIAEGLEVVNRKSQKIQANCEPSYFVSPLAGYV